MTSFIIIPAKNEGKTIQSVIKIAKKFGKVVVVDDGSTDDTAQIAQKEKATVLTHIVNLGKGSALKTGCEYALLQGATKIVVIDADAQHDPKQIPSFLELLDSHDIVFGYRKKYTDMPGLLRFGNQFINNVARVLYGVTLHDTQCGYRSFTSDAYKKLRWSAQDYSVESEMISITGKKNLRYTQFPIQTVYHDNYKGTTVFDGVKIVLKMFWWKVSS